MSRGLGTMQHEILGLYDEAESVLATYPWPARLTAQTHAAMREVREVARMRRLLAEQFWRGGGDDPSCSVQATFARALRSLIRRGLLRACSLDGRPVSPARGARIQYVVKC